MSNAEQIRKLEEQIATLKAADVKFAAMKPEYQLATSLHRLLCHSNHTDGCSWEYEFSNGQIEWDKYAHKKYIEKALVILGFCQQKGIEISDVLELLDLTKGH